jgi:1-deoxy-D-xylulose-5-phosphate synthase
MRRKGGLMGYPNPAESDYDLFMTGHAGCSISCLLGLKTGDDLAASLPDRDAQEDRGDPWRPSTTPAACGSG